MNILTLLTAPFVALGVALGSLFTPQVVVVPQTVEVPKIVQVPQLGASEAVPVVVAFFETTLASAITSSATSFTLTSATDKDGTTLASSTYAFVIDEGSSNEEVVIADCTGTACTNAMRGVSALTGNTEVTALKKAHRRGASIKITDAPILMLVSRALRGDDVTNFTPVGNGSLVDKQYVDSLSLGSTTVSATLTDDGILELATGTQAASSTATDQSGSPLALHTGISTSTAPTSGAYVVVTGQDGNIAQDFMPTSIADALDLQLFTASSTWTKPTGNYSFVQVELWGAGGSGGAQSNGSIGAGGGGGGGYVKGIFAYASVATTVDVTIGSGGLSVNTTGAVAGNAGGTTTFGSYLTVYGGGGGSAGVSSAASGGGGGGCFFSAGSAGVAGVPGAPLCSIGGVESTIAIDAIYGAGGGGDGATTYSGGADSLWGGAGGGGCKTNAGGANGTSTFGGNGGIGNGGGTAGTVGAQPGGGGGAGCRAAGGTSTSGAGGDGYARIITF